MTMVAKDLQSSKQFFPKLVTDDGIVMAVKE